MARFTRFPRRRWKTLLFLLFSVILLIQLLTSTSWSNPELEPDHDDGLCPEEPPELQGPIHINLLTGPTPNLAQVASNHPDIIEGGHWSPPNCTARQKVAILVPYRDRLEHLHIFLKHIHPILRRQLLDYSVYVIEQHGDEAMFCKGLLYNIGFTEVLKNRSYDCFIFHDVDLLLEDDRNTYSCLPSPRHLSVAIDKFNYTLPYKQLFGGVTALSAEHYKRLNGYSNLFCGWGGEDDDMYMRLRKSGLEISRPDKTVARYKMMRHNQTKLNPIRFSLLKTSKQRFEEDGLSSLNHMDYHHHHYQIASMQHRLFTHIAVSVVARKPVHIDSLIINGTLGNK